VTFGCLAIAVAVWTAGIAQILLGINPIQQTNSFEINGLFFFKSRKN